MSKSRTAVFRELNERQKKFVYAYVANGFNGTKAAIEAGYSSRGASQASTRLLNLGKVRQAIAYLKDRQLVKASVTTEYVIDKLTAIVDSSRSDSAKVQSLKLLGMYLGMWGDGTSNVNVQVVNQGRDDARDVLAALPPERLRQLRDVYRTVATESGIEVQVPVLEDE